MPRDIPGLALERDRAAVARQTIEIGAVERGEAFELVQRARGFEGLRVQLDAGVRGEDSGAAAGRLLGRSARAARCRCRGRSAVRRARPPRAAPARSASASAPAGSSGAGGCRRRTARCGSCSRCCGVTVAATPARAPRTNSTAARVVMCSNTTRSVGQPLDERREHLRSMKRASRSKMSTAGSVTSPCTCSTTSSSAMRVEHRVDAADVGDAGCRSGWWRRPDRACSRYTQPLSLARSIFGGRRVVGEVQRHQRLEREARGERCEDARGGSASACGGGRDRRASGSA